MIQKNQWVLTPMQLNLVYILGEFKTKDEHCTTGLDITREDLQMKK